MSGSSSIRPVMELSVARGEALIVLGAGATAGSGFMVQDSRGGAFPPPTDKGFWARIGEVAGRGNFRTPAIDGLRTRLRLDAPGASLEEVWNVLAIHKKYAAQNFL